MTEETKTTLGVADLAGVVRIIDVCSKRGAFEGSEMVAVGSLREKIAAFVEENTPKGDEEDPAADATAEDTVDG